MNTISGHAQKPPFKATSLVTFVKIPPNAKAEILPIGDHFLKGHKVEIVKRGQELNISG